MTSNQPADMLDYHQMFLIGMAVSELGGYLCCITFEDAASERFEKRILEMLRGKSAFSRSEAREFIAEFSKWAIQEIDTFRTSN